MNNEEELNINKLKNEEIEAEIMLAPILKAVLDATPLAINVWNDNMVNIMCNKQVRDIFNIGDESEYLENFYKFSPEYQPNGISSLEMSQKHFEEVLSKGSHIFNWMHITLDGKEIPSRITLKRITSSGGEVMIVGFVDDLRNTFSMAKNTSYDYYFLDRIPQDVLLEEMSLLSDEWFFSMDIRTGNLHYHGKIWFEGFGDYSLITTEEIFKLGFIHEDDRDKYLKMVNDLTSGISESYDIRIATDIGTYHYFRIICKVIQDNQGKPIFAIGKAMDIQEEKNFEELSQKDLLTDCLNKISAENIISNKLSKNSEGTHTFFIVDIDNFKGINDNLGHFFGDEVLREISQGLKTVFSENDLVARIGGDEFIIFVENLSDRKLIEEKAKKILEIYTRTYSGDYRDYSISGSVGIAIYPKDGKTYNELYQNSDKALNQGKLLGKNRYVIYNNDLDIETIRSSTKIENANRIAASYFDYDLISTVFNILYESNGDSLSINLALKYLCQAYNADRSYIFETLDGGETYDNTFEWCKEGITSEINNLKQLPKELFADFIDKAHDDIIYSNNLRETFSNEISFKKMADQGILSFVHAQVKRDGVMRFFIGLDDCTRTRIWNEREINSLQYLGKLLSIILQGRHLNDEVDKLVEKNKNSAFIMDSTNNFVYVLDIDTYDILYLNQSTLNAFGNPSEEVWRSKKCYEFLQGKSEPCEFCTNHLLTEDKYYEWSIYNEQLDIPLLLKDKLIPFNGKLAKLEVATDISKIIELERELQKRLKDETELVAKLNKLSYYDSLTGIKNRHSYTKALKEMDSKYIESLGVAYIDITNLSAINDAKGILFGDEILKSLANKLENIFGEGVFRVDGDEFVVLKENIDEMNFEENIALLKKQLNSEEEFSVTIGYTWNINLKNLKNEINELHIADKYNRILAENLDMEILNNKYLVYLQPQVDLTTNKVKSAEALVRRIGAKGILQPPISFIPFYEKEGIISKVDLFVLETICKTIKAWKDSNYEELEAIAVNCSRVTIAEKGIVESFSKICEKYNVEKSKIIIEITETINGINEAVLAEIIKNFNEAGFTVSLDDFGSGYSNLTSLISSDFDEIKIDMKLINEIHINKKSKALTESAILLCKNLGNIISVAEGVEILEQYEILKNMECAKGQGYYFDKPLPIEEFTEKYMKK